MNRIIDITSKLNFEIKPTIKIKDVDIIVDNRAITVLKLMELTRVNKNFDDEFINKACKILFDKENLKKLEELELNFNDFSTVVSTAMDLAVGAEEKEKTGSK